MSEHILGKDRSEALLFPPSIDEYVSENNSVRFIDAFVSGLDMEDLGFKHAKPPADRKGRRPYDPGDLLKLYIYGYLNRIRSSRKLEAETHRNLEVIWLMAHLQPDHKTIANFRSTHPSELKKVFQEFHLLCKKLNLYGRLIAIDGSAIKASNNLSNSSTRTDINELLKQADERINEYLTQLDQADKQEEPLGGLEEAGLKLKIEKINEEKERLAAQLETMDRDGKNHCPHNDPDARMLKKNGKTLIGHNVQVAVESESHLIVAEEVTADSNDMHQLEPMVEKTIEALEEGEGDSKEDSPLKFSVDKGYENHEQIAASERMGVEIYLPLNETPSAKSGLFTADQFTHDDQLDVMICPAGKQLARKSDSMGTRVMYRVYYTVAACKNCPLIARCTAGNYRKIKVSECAKEIEEVRQRVKSHPEICRQRKGIVEHIFGSIKQWMNQGDFYCTGREKVGAEFTLSCLAYNMRRALNLLSVAELIEAARA